MLLKSYKNLSLGVKASIWFAVCNAVQSGIKFLTMPFLTRLMSSQQYGVVTVFNSWVAIVAVIATLNLSQAVFNNGMAYYPDKRDRFASSMLGLTLACTLIVAFLSGVVFQVQTFSLTGLDGMQLACLFLTVFSNAVFSMWAARNRYEYRYRSLLFSTLVYAVVVAVLSVVAVAFTPDDSAKALVQITTSSLTGACIVIVIFVVMLKRGRTLFDKGFWIFALKFNVPLIPHYLAMILLGQVDRIMIADIMGESQAAIYAVAYQISIALTIITNAVNSAVIPWLYEKLKSQEYDGISERITLLVGLSGVLAFLLACVAPELLFFFAPAEYYEAVYVMPPVCATTLFMFLYCMYANIEFYYMSNKFIVVATCLGAVFKVLLNLICIPQFGYMSAGYTTLVSYAAMVFAHTLFARRVFRKKTGEESALYSDMKLWGIAAVTVMACVSCIVAYSFPWVRVLILVVAALIAWRNRSLIASSVMSLKRPST